MRLGHEGDPMASMVEEVRKNARKERFEAEALAAREADGVGVSAEWQDGIGAAPALGQPIVGLSPALFRPFVRLRSAPDPGKVRPEHILRASLKALLDEDSRPPGGWEAVREQLWSIRQDLLVQHLHKGELAAEVAIEGARMAVSAGDVAELHRSLAALVANGPCAARVRKWPKEVQDEVAALRLLYLTHGGLEGQPGRLEVELAEFFRCNPCGRSRGPLLAFAVQVHQARRDGNWVRQLSLASEGPPASASQPARKGRAGLATKKAADTCETLAQLLVKSARKNGLMALLKAFPQGLCSKRAAKLLGFANESALGLWLSLELQLEEAKAVHLLRGGRMDCASISTRWGQLQKAASTAAAHERSTSSDYSLLPKGPGKEGEAAIWGELRSFVAKQAKQDEILRKMAERKAKKGSKKEKSEKKELKKLKKERKKLKKALKKEKKEKQQQREQKKARKNGAPEACEVASSSSSSDSDGDVEVMESDG